MVPATVSQLNVKGLADSHEVPRLEQIETHNSILTISLRASLVSSWLGVSVDIRAKCIPASVTVQPSFETC